jgi:hypothetical protein
MKETVALLNDERGEEAERHRFGQRPSYDRPILLAMRVRDTLSSGQFWGELNDRALRTFRFRCPIRFPRIPATGLKNYAQNL